MDRSTYIMWELQVSLLKCQLVTEEQALGRWKRSPKVKDDMFKCGAREVTCCSVHEHDFWAISVESWTNPKNRMLIYLICGFRLALRLAILLEARSLDPRTCFANISGHIYPTQERLVPHCEILCRVILFLARPCSLSFSGLNCIFSSWF